MDYPRPKFDKFFQESMVCRLWAWNNNYQIVVSVCQESGNQSLFENRYTWLAFVLWEQNPRVVFTVKQGVNKAEKEFYCLFWLFFYLFDWLLTVFTRFCQQKFSFCAQKLIFCDIADKTSWLFYIKVTNN